MDKGSAGGRCQTACKPGSVRTRVAAGCGTTIPLGRALRRASRDQPGRRGGNAPGAGRLPAAPIRSCSRWGLPCHPCCQGRGALLPHRFALARGTPCGCTGGLFSVALSLGSPPPAVGRHRIPVEPGLSSRLAAPAAVQPSGEARDVRASGRKQGCDTEKATENKMNALRAKRCSAFRRGLGGPPAPRGNLVVFAQRQAAVTATRATARASRHPPGR